jgi:hypothetical protein
MEVQEGAEHKPLLGARVEDENGGGVVAYSINSAFGKNSDPLTFFHILLRYVAALF